MNAINPTDPRTALESMLITNLDPDDPSFSELPAPNPKFPNVQATNGLTSGSSDHTWHVFIKPADTDLSAEDAGELAQAIAEAAVQAEIMNAAGALELDIDVDEWTGPTAVIELTALKYPYVSQFGDVDGVWSDKCKTIGSTWKREEHSLRFLGTFRAIQTRIVDGRPRTTLIEA